MNTRYTSLIPLIPILKIWSKLEQSYYQDCVVEISASELVHGLDNKDQEAVLKAQTIAADTLRDLCNIYKSERKCNVDMNPNGYWGGGYLCPTEWHIMEYGLFGGVAAVKVIKQK